MLGVLDAALRLRTVRRWIRSGRVPATKVGLQYLVDERDLPSSTSDGFPDSWGQTNSGEPSLPLCSEQRRRRPCTRPSSVELLGTEVAPLLAAG